MEFFPHIIFSHIFSHIKNDSRILDNYIKTNEFIIVTSGNLT